MKSAAFGSIFAFAVFASMARASDQMVLDLWPGRAPGETGKAVEEKSKVETWGRSVTNITKPTLTVYRPAKEKDAGAALIIAPGGAFRFLAIEHEGDNVAQWCNTIGVTGIVLKYRVPRRPDHPQAALQDGQRAVSLVRSKAQEWRIDPDRIGMIGFSAGGGVTGYAMLNADKRAYKEVDDVDKVSCRLNFAVIIYSSLQLASGDLKGPEPTVGKDTPPTFLAVAHDDFLVADTVNSYLALKKAGVPAELHVYAAGGHGFGLRASNPPPANDWTARLEAWMKHRKLLAVNGTDAPQAPQSRSTGSSSIIAPGARLEKLAGDFKFTEGPAADAAGNVYFTDQPNDRILKWSADGKLMTFMQPCGRSNGLCFDADGNLWACADEKNELWRIDPKGKATVVVKNYKGKLLNGPNDVWICSDGGLYFTDPFYKRDYWKRGPKEQDSEAVYYLSPDHKNLTRVVADLQQPNGIIGTPDGKTLYVADIKGNKTFAYDIEQDGTLKNKRLFCELGSDGMTIDQEGNVYLTGQGVTVFDKTGKQIEHIPVPEPWTANVCFGGKDKRTLFITASKSLYSLNMRVRGAGSQ
jgi:gluconolactonase